MSYEIRGGCPLYGTAKIHGAKNSVLPILAATVLVRGACEIHNCPQISDVAVALEILRALGCRASMENGTVCVDASCVTKAEIDETLMQRMRSSILFLGSLLARCGECTLSYPGGCVLGQRPIDLHLRAVTQLGGTVTEEDGRLSCKAVHLHGGIVCLPIASVGATENILLMAMGTQEEILLCNAAREPEIVDLCAFLRACGADISGEGTGLVRIRGCLLHGCSHTVVPDRIETATYLSCAACAGGRVELTDCCPMQLSPVISLYQRAGCKILQQESTLTIEANRLAAVSPIHTAPFPGFPTDAQALVMAAMARADGISIFVEHMFSSRFRHVQALQQMGANICACKRIAVVSGVACLHGAEVTATDLRGGAAMVAAALGAEGTTTINQTEHIARGYASFPETLRQLGAQITNEDDTYGGKTSSQTAKTGAGVA